MRWERWQAKRRAKLPESSRQPVSDTCPKESSNPRPADLDTRQQCVEQNIPCTIKPDSESSQPEEPKASHTIRDVDFPPGEVEEADPDESDSEDSPEAFLKWLAKQPKCFSCYTPETGPNELKKCTKCKIATYCDRWCQAEHWREHRHMCKASL